MLVSINSARRVSGASSTQFTVAIPSGVYRIKGLELISASIPKTWYNVAAELKNNTLSFDAGAGVSTITIPDGGYSANGLASTIQGLMNAITPGFTVAVSTTSYKTTIAWGGGVYTLSFGATGVGPTIGFTLASYTGATTYTGGNIIDLDQPRSLFIGIDNISSTGRASGGLLGFNWSLSASGYVSGDLIEWKQQNEYVQIQPTDREYNIQTLSMRLTDDQGNIMNLNGGNWECVIRFHLADDRSIA